MLLVNLFISCHRTSNNPQLSNITVLHTIKLLKQLNTSYVLGCTCRKKKKCRAGARGERKGGKLKFLTPWATEEVGFTTHWKSKADNTAADRANPPFPFDCGYYTCDLACIWCASVARISREVQAERKWCEDVLVLISMQLRNQAKSRHKLLPSTWCKINL